MQARPKNSWVKWATQRNRTATAFPTVSSWTCSILSPTPTSCECCHYFSLFKIIDGIFRKCDSRNLNLNPLCMLKAGPLPALWTERVITSYNRLLLNPILGERDLQNLWQLNPLLHLNLVQPNEEKAQGPAACHRVNGKTLSCKMFDVYFKDEFYNAWEEDIAVVNIFFGKGTVMGEKDLFRRIYLKSCQSLSEASEWVLWTSLPPLEGSLASALDSASSHSLRSSTGFLLASLRPLSTRCKRLWAFHGQQNLICDTLLGF